MIAEPESAAGLIERRPAPDAAGKILVEQPAIEEQVDAFVGRLDIQCGERVLPERFGGFESGVRRLGSAVFGDERRNFRRTVRLPEENNDLGLGSWFEVNRDAQGTTGVAARSGKARKRLIAAQGQRRRGRAVAAQKLGAVAGVGRNWKVTGKEGRATAEVGAVAVSRRQAVGVGVPVGDQNATACLLDRHRVPIRHRRSPLVCGL